MDGFDAFYERLRTIPNCRRPRSPRSATSWRSGSRCSRRAGTSSRSTSPAASPGPCEAARQAHALLAEKGLGERVEVIDGETGCGGAGTARARRLRGRRGGRRARRRRRARARGARVAAHLVLRSTRSSTCAAAGASARRRRGSEGRCGSSRSSRSSSKSCRSSACARRGARSSGWSATREELHEAGADGWVVQHIQAPEQARAADRALPRDLRLRTDLHLGGRPRDRHLHRAGADRRRRRAALAAGLSAPHAPRRCASALVVAGRFAALAVRLFAGEPPLGSSAATGAGADSLGGAAASSFLTCPGASPLLPCSSCLTAASSCFDGGFFVLGRRFFALGLRFFLLDGLFFVAGRGRGAFVFAVRFSGGRFRGRGRTPLPRRRPRRRCSDRPRRERSRSRLRGDRARRRLGAVAELWLCAKRDRGLRSWRSTRRRFAGTRRSGRVESLHVHDRGGAAATAGV